MAEISDLNPTDASNVGRWPENMAFSAVNDAGRAMEGYLARWFRDINGGLASSGSSNAFAVTSNRAIASLVDGIRLTFRANHSITGAATLDLNGIGAKDIRRFNGQALASGDIVSGQPVDVVYSAALDDWIMVSALAALTGNTFVDLGENASPGNPAADVARVYAKDESGATLLAYRDSAGTERVLRAAAETTGALIAIIEDQKAQNTAAQTLSSGSDQTRELNTLVYNRDAVVTLNSNQFTLPAGTWEIEWGSPHRPQDAGVSQSFLYNVTDTAEVARGTSVAFNDGNAESASVTVVSRGSAVVTIAAPKAFAIRHRVSATDPGGSPANFGTEVYTRVIVRRG